MTTPISRALATTALVAFAALSAPALAQDQTGTNVAKDAAQADGPVSQLAMAQQLYDYGIAAEDALSVLAAARIVAAIDVTDADRAPEESGEATATAEEGEGVDAPADAATMLATARALAGGDATILGLIEDAEAEGSRGRIGGPSRTLSRLPAGRYDRWTIPFYGGRYAEIAIIGDGDADLDAIIADENGNTICIDTSYSDNLRCSFTPRWDGYFTVIVTNVGRVRNSYYLLTN